MSAPVGIPPGSPVPDRRAESASDSFGLIGSILDGRYRIDRVVGEGGFGIVYKATHVVLDGPVAIKVLKLPPEVTPAERGAFLDSFREEGKLLFRLSALHSSVVQAREAGVALWADGRAHPYLALEWLDGVSLDRELRFRRSQGAPPLSLHQALRLLDGIAQGLAVAHAQRIAHRDLKPANIFLCRRNGALECKLLDFGLAKVMDQSASPHSMYERTAATPSAFTRTHGAPEQWLRRLGATGPWTDVHSLALILVELLTLEHALQGDDAAALMACCLDKEVRPSPNARGAQLPDGVERVFLRALALDPRERFGTAGEFWAALQQAAQSADADPGEASPRILVLESRRGSDPPQARNSTGGTTSTTADSISQQANLRVSHATVPAPGSGERSLSPVSSVGPVQPSGWPVRLGLLAAAAFIAVVAALVARPASHRSIAQPSASAVAESAPVPVVATAPQPLGVVSELSPLPAAPSVRAEAPRPRDAKQTSSSPRLSVAPSAAPAPALPAASSSVDDDRMEVLRERK